MPRYHIEIELSSTEMAILSQWSVSTSTPVSQLIKRATLGAKIPDCDDEATLAIFCDRLKKAEAAAHQLFGQCGQDAWEWLTSAPPALGGRSPVSLLGSEAGMEEVLALIGRIEDGIPT